MGLEPLEPLPPEAVVVNGGTPFRFGGSVTSALGATGAGDVQQAPMTGYAATRSARLGNQMIVDLESSPATIPAIPSYHPQIDFLSYLLPSPSVGKERRHDCKTREGTCRGPPLGVLSLTYLSL